MLNPKLDFSTIEWESSPSGAKSKTLIRDKKKFRMVELPKRLNHPEWCKIGHIGFVLEGELEIEFEEKTLTYKKGDGILIRSGEEEKHIPKPISEKVVLFFVEDV